MTTGFKDKDKKFHPTEKKSELSSEQVRSVAETNPEIDNKNLKAIKSEMVTKRGQLLPAPYTDEWNKLKDDVSDRFDKDFNSIPFENITTINEYWFEDVISQEPRMMDIKDFFGERKLSDEEFEEAHNESEIDDAKQELRDSASEIIWGTVFEAKDSFLADKIRDNAEKLTNDIGLVVIDMSNSDKADNYNTGVFLGVGSAGHDFFESYWVPMYRMFGWI